MNRFLYKIRDINKKYLYALFCITELVLGAFLCNHYWESINTQIHGISLPLVTGYTIIFINYIIIGLLIKCDHLYDDFTMRFSLSFFISTLIVWGTNIMLSKDGSRACGAMEPGACVTLLGALMMLLGSSLLFYILKKDE